MKRWFALVGPALPLGLAYLAFFVAPLLMLVAVSFFTDDKLTVPGFDNWRKFLFDSFHWKVVADTLLLGLKAVFATVLLGLPLALVWRGASPFWQRVLLFVAVMPLLTSVVVRTFAWIVILGRQGIINSALLDIGLIEGPLKLLYTRFGLILALVNVQLPLMVLPLINTLQRLDPNLEDASSVLGAGEWRTFFKVTFPLSLPGIVAGCLLTFAASITAFITQALIGGGQMLFMPMYLYQQASSLNNYPLAAAISITFLVAVMICVTLFNLLGRLSRGYAQA